MGSMSSLLMFAQLLFLVVGGLYFFQGLRNQNSTKSSFKLDSEKEMQRLKKMRSVTLTKPLAEKARPTKLSEVIGQENGVKALKAALCSSNPQHVLIYGPPGIGKTAAARLILEEAKQNAFSPFESNAKFIEIDATTLRFDERSIADPLMGSVHDPIYQGAGAFGAAGIPQPKEGAVTKANGGVLFIDEIGELHPVQMNKLLKVLEDRVVYFTSSYYSSENTNIPEYIHDIFKNGLPADFRLVGATTRSPEEIPPALRSRCTEIYFEELSPSHVQEIAFHAVKKTGCISNKEIIDKVAQYADNGRDAVNMVQTAASVAFLEGRKQILIQDLDWVLESGRYTPKLRKKIEEKSKIGVVNGLAVYGGGKGALLEVEVTAKKAYGCGKGKIKVTGIVEKEEIKSSTGTIKRTSNVKASVENVITTMENLVGIAIKDYNIHINFPGGAPVDGPSAGIAIFCAVYSAITKKIILPKVAMTGELSIMGKVMPVGGVAQKVQAAIEAGAKMVLIPDDNWQSTFSELKIEIVRTKDISQVMKLVFNMEEKESIVLEKKQPLTQSTEILTAQALEG